ncbi:MAG: hypothetical protein DRN05_01100 [Thermoplasmata archaeon]|nr:MAG: hypothetical protein DRN05_01100 [Thermoplasmata archaeon]
MKIYVEDYGCTANKNDTSILLGILKQDRHRIVKKIDDADVLILVTCTVIGTTEQRMLSRLKVFKKTNKKLVVTGCMAAVQPDLIRSIAPDAKILPPRYNHHILDIITEKKDIAFVEKNKTLMPKYYHGITAPIAIAEGCTSSCSYCITRFARGKLTSYPIHEIIQDIHAALKQGCKEIQITAQDTASYGLDTGSNLARLLSEICSIKASFKIRVGMMNPFTTLKNLDSILEAYADNKIYKFLHLPVQSGDNTILKRMNRGYTVEDFMGIIRRFRKRYPEITIATDIIVGFPGETKEHFQHTIDLIKKTKPDVVNITRYSTRPYTEAKKMKKIPTDIVKERSKKLTEICKKIAETNNLRHVGKKYDILIVEKGKNNTYIGRTENYKPIVIKEKVKIGSFVTVEIENAETTHLVGKLI